MKAYRDTRGNDLSACRGSSFSVGGRELLDPLALWLLDKGWEREFKFHPTRKWRLDWAYPKSKIGLEIEGGVWTGGRHTSGAGFTKDMEKYNALTVLGWRLLRYTPKQFKDGAPLKDLEDMGRQK